MKDKRPTPSEVPSAPHLVQAAELLCSIFPVQSSRPSLRWLARMKARRLIPYKKIGRLVFYDPDEVRQAIDRLFTVRSKNL